MLYNNALKAHWLAKIEELGHRFDPDCGNRKPEYEHGDAAPLNVLSNLYGDDCLWTNYEREFQLPKWILNCIDTHMHDVSPRTSKEDLASVFEACKTYTDLDLLYHEFSQKLLIYCITNFGDIRAELNSEAYYGPVWAHLLVHEQLLAKRKEISALNLSHMIELQREFEYWGNPGSKYQYFTWVVEAILKRWTGNFPEYLEQLHKLKGNNVSLQDTGKVVLTFLLETLRGDSNVNNNAK